MLVGHLNGNREEAASAPPYMASPSAVKKGVGHEAPNGQVHMPGT